MLQSDYTFVLKVTEPGGHLLHQGEILSSVTPCYDELLFQGTYEGHFPNDGTRPLAVLTPVWAESGAPKISGIEMALPPMGHKKFDLSILGDDLRLIVSNWRSPKPTLKESHIESEEAESLKITWEVSAHAHPRSTKKPSRLSVKLVRPPLPFANKSLHSLGIRGKPSDQQPVAIMMSDQLLLQMRADAAQSPEKERANILTGHLVRDSSLEQPVVVILNKIPADADTAASRTHFAFSPLTFQAVQQQLDKRTDGEVIVGWHHTHPPPCGWDCYRVTPPCQTGSVFFSSADRQVQRATFFSPYMVGLVSGKGAGRSPADPETRAYGWQAGLIVERAYTVF